MALQSGWVLLNILAPISVVVYKYLLCDVLLLTIFCAHALFDYAYDMDHMFEKIIIIVSRPRPATRGGGKPHS